MAANEVRQLRRHSWMRGSVSDVFRYGCIVAETVYILFFVECYDGWCSTVCKTMHVCDRTLFSDDTVQNCARVVCEPVQEGYGAEQKHN